MRLSRRAAKGTAVAVLSLGLTLTPTAVSMADPSETPTPSPSAAASPRPKTVAEARVALDTLRVEQQQVEGRAAEIEKRLSDTSDRIDEKQGDIQEHEAQIKKAKQRLAEIALNQYQDRDADSPTALLLNAGDTSSFLDQLSAADNIADNNTAMLEDYESELATLTDEKRALEADKVSAKKDFEELESLRQQVADKIKAAQTIFEQLDKSERDALLASDANLRADGTSRDDNRLEDPSSDDGGEENTYPAPQVDFSGYNGYAFGNCTYYAFARRKQLGRPILNGWHHAKYWPAGARAAGFVVDTKPEVGAVYVTFRGYYGHVMVVEKVLGGGAFVVSEMNYHGGPGTGFNRVSTRVIPSVGGVFIH